MATDARIQRPFLALIAAQAAHSAEEYAFRLYDVFAPARFVSGLVSSDLRLGFAIANAVIVLFGAWCYVARVRKGEGRGLAMGWTAVEAVNGTGHLFFAAAGGAYFPGAATAPLLLASSYWLGRALLRTRHAPQ